MCIGFDGVDETNGEAGGCFCDFWPQDHAAHGKSIKLIMGSRRKLTSSH